MTVRVAGFTATASVPDEPVAEVTPLFLGKEFCQILLGLYRIGVGGKTESERKASYMGIHHYACIDPKGIPKDDIGRLASDAWKS